MERHLICIDGVHIHYRKIGQGPLLFLLHPSPRSSKMYEGFMKILSDQFCIIAPDLPGYGFSDPLPNKVETVYDYMPTLNGFFSHFSAGSFQIYGSATGAQLAIAYGLTHPDSVKCLYLDNAADFTDKQRNQILAGYFPDLSPNLEGGHLIKTWYHIRDSFLFFPWFDYKNGKRLINGLPPVSVLQECMLDYMLAGQNWDSAYKAAFGHEKAEQVQSLSCNVIIFRWVGGIMLEFVDQLLDNQFSSNITIEEIPPSMQERYEGMKKVFVKMQNSV